MTTVPYDPDLDPVLAALEQRCKDATAISSAALASRISTLNGELAEVKGEVVDLKGRIAKAEADAGALLERIAALEATEPPPPPPSLDKSGNTVPTSNYPIPPGAIFVSPAGNNANPGTEAAPKRTVFGSGGAYSVVPVDGTIVMRGGIYEEGTTGGGHSVPSTRPFTIQAYPGEQVWFDGSTVVAGWQGTGPWTVPGWTFDAGNTSGFTTDKPSTTFYFDQLFIDGALQRRVASAPAAGEFSVSGGTITVGSNPLGREVRVSRYRGLMVASARVNLLGIGVRRYANGSPQESGSTSGYAAIYYGGLSAGTRIERCAFVDHACIPLTVAKAGFTITGNVFVRSGKSHAQIGGTTGADGLKLVGNVFHRSNHGGWPAEPTAGAVKICKTDQGVITDNVVEDAPGVHLLWFDQTCTRCVVARNTIISTPGRESKSGLLWEISGGGLLPLTGTRTQHWSYIVGNTIKGSVTYAGLSLLGSNWTKVWCNTIEAARDMCVMVRQDNRPTGLAETAPTSYRYGAVDFMVHDIEMCNNDVGPSSRYAQLAAWNSNGVHPPSANTMFARLSGNWFADGNTNGASACMWGETNQDSSRVNYKLIPTSAGAGALDSRTSFVANGWRNFQGGTTPPATREPIPADIAALLVAPGA